MNKFCPICGKPTDTAGNCPDWGCNRYTQTPVLPQKILKLDWGHRAVATAPVVFADTDNARFEQRINDLKRKQDEIIDVINDMRGVK